MDKTQQFGLSLNSLETSQIKQLHNLISITENPSFSSNTNDDRIALTIKVMKAYHVKSDYVDSLLSQLTKVSEPSHEPVDSQTRSTSNPISYKIVENNYNIPKETTFFPYNLEAADIKKHASMYKF